MGAETIPMICCWERIQTSALIPKLIDSFTDKKISEIYTMKIFLKLRSFHFESRSARRKLEWVTGWRTHLAPGNVWRREV
jgi:hypothetical protein